MEILTINNLAPYLPYKLKIQINNPENEISTSVLSTSDYDWLINRNYGKPILRPISDFLKQEWKDILMIAQDDKTEDDWFLEAVEFEHNFIYADFQNLTYRSLEVLFKNHFDVFGLIKKGLAIDINSLTTK